MWLAAVIGVAAESVLRIAVKRLPHSINVRDAIPRRRAALFPFVGTRRYAGPAFRWRALGMILPGRPFEDQLPPRFGERCFLRANARVTRIAGPARRVDLVGPVPHRLVSDERDRLARALVRNLAFDFGSFRMSLAKRGDAPHFHATLEVPGLP